MGYTFKMQNWKKVKRFKSGGIILGYKDCLDAFIEPIDTDCKFVLWCKISKLISNDDVILGIIYVPPEYTSYSSPDAINHIENYYLNLFTKYKKCLFVGDFNVRTAEEQDYIYILKKTTLLKILKVL